MQIFHDFLIENHYRMNTLSIGMNFPYWYSNMKVDACCGFPEELAVLSEFSAGKWTGTFKWLGNRLIHLKFLTVEDMTLKIDYDNLHVYQSHTQKKKGTKIVPLGALFACP